MSAANTENYIQRYHHWYPFKTWQESNAFFSAMASMLSSTYLLFRWRTNFTPTILPPYQTCYSPGRHSVPVQDEAARITLLVSWTKSLAHIHKYTHTHHISAENETLEDHTSSMQTGLEERPVTGRFCFCFSFLRLRRLWVEFTSLSKLRMRNGVG